MVAFGVFAVAAVADAPDGTQTVNYSNLGFAPNQASVVSVVYDPTGDGGLGTTTLTVKGGWAWPTHGSDCNTDRSGAGYAMDWYDAHDAGYAIGNTGISVGSQNPNHFAANTDANVVQPTPGANDPSNPADVQTVSSPASFASWGGGCGKVSTGTVTGWTGGGNPPTSFSQGFWGPISHTYVGSPSSLPSKVCAITYDVHPGKTAASQTDGLGIPSSASEITAGGNGANGDNSMQGNNGTPAGNTCTAILIPNTQITKTADAASVNAGDQVGFTVEVKNTGSGAATGATLSDPLPAGSGTGVTWAIDTSTGTPTQFVLSGAKGSQTLGLASSTIPAGADYKVHITASTSASECSTYNNTATLTTTNGVNPLPASASEACLPAHVTVTKTADAASVNAGDQVGFTVEVKNTGTGIAKGVSLGDALPAGTGTGVTWAVDNSTGTPANFVLAGSKGSQTLGLASSTLPAGADYTIHITAMTSFAECSTYNNTATLTTTNANNPSPASATETCNPSAIHIVKTPDAAQVNAGDQIGFTLTVYNTGTGDAKGTTLSDPLPTNAGLSWQIASQGAGWGSTCAITSGTLNCGPKTVPAGTTQAGSTFTVHITSTTTAATGGVCPGGSGVVNNTGSVTTTNGGSDQSNASTCVAGPTIKIVKTADAAQVSAGDQIGFTVTVYNTGTGDAKGTTLSDPLPTNAGLSWQIASQGAGWASTCAISLGTLNCGPVTVPANTTQAGSTFTVHITSPTTSATGGSCPNTGVVDNTGTVTTTNGGSGQSSASTCVAAPSIQIVKTADAAQVNAGDQIGFTVTVFNTGTGDAKGVKLSDPLPTNPGLSWQIASQGSGWASTCAITAGTLNCGGVNGVTVPFGTTQVGSTFTVHITSTTTAATGGVCPGGSGVVNNTGTVTTTNAGSLQSSASTCVAGPTIQIVKTADAAQVNAGDQIGFTVTVYNSGTGDAKGVSLSDPLPTAPGLSWQIASQGAGWAGTCAISAGTLNCGPVTVPAGTTQAASTFTVHITSPTTAATGGVCPGGSGVVNNTGTVTTTNGGSGQSSASTCVAAPAIHIVKTADAAQVNAGDQIGFTLTVYNTGTGDAKGVHLSDPLPTNAGLSWQIASQGSGWAGTCAIAAGTLTCGPVTVPADTTQAASTFKVHITSTTTAATGGVCPSGSGVVNNTGSVTTTNDGSDQSSASTCVAAPAIHIVKTADAAQVNAGDQIGFTLTVYNSGTGDAKGVNLSDPLPTNAGLSWQIQSQGAGWASTCAIAAGTLTCGPVTVPAGTTQAGSTFTVHITSTTTAATGGGCPGGSGVVNNTGSVTTTNDGSGQSSALTCVASPSIQIVKTADAAQVSAGDQIGFTVTVYNSGTGDAKGVNLSDPLPANAGLSWQIASQGAGWAGTCAISAGTLSCGPVTVPAGTTQAGSSFKVHITSTTTASTGGSCPNTGVVTNTGSVTTTNDGSGQSTASVCVAAPGIQILKTADAAQVNAGDQIGFTLTVYNTGTGDAKGVTLSDPLPTNAGLSWQIANQGVGWGGSCAIVAGTLSCGPVTVPFGTTQVGSSFTVHITSTTTAATGGVCPGGSGVVNNTGTVNTTNAGSVQSSASTCVAAPAIHIVKTADAAQVSAGDQIGFTLTVYNSGTGDAKGVSLSDPLPTNPGLSWQIQSQGAGWGGSCAIVAGTLSCGPVTVAAATTQLASTFTVHITSTTTAATGGVCPGGSGVVNNTGSVTTTNDGSGQSSASTCVAAPAIHIVKTADAAQVNAGDQIGFTLTVYNSGTGDAKGVSLSDPLPTNPGLSWQIQSQGAGWGGSCAIVAGTLSCGPVTVPTGTTQVGSSFTVHITSTTTAATGGVCPGGSGVVNNTGSVTTTNDGSGQSSASTCVAGPSIQIVKTADAAQVNAGDQIGFTLTVYNSGTGDAKGVSLSDPLPTNAGLSWQIQSQGAGWASTCAIAAGTLTCGPVTVAAGTTQLVSTFTVHITSTTTAATGGVCPGGSGVVNNTGSVTTTNDGSGQSTASTCVAAPAIHIVKTADAAQVSAGDQIGFTVTVYNSGTGDAKGVNLSDPLPTNPGLSWQIQNQGAGWGGSCAIVAGTLTCGPATVTASTTQAASTFTVHITSTTTASTGGSCPNTGVVTNTGSVTTTNDGSGQSTASTCVAAPSIQILKTADAAQVNAGDQIGFTVTVYNTGTGDAKGVTLSDPLPTNAGLSWQIQNQGSGWSGSCAIAAGTLTCGPVTVPFGTTFAGSTFTVHITSTTTAQTGGVCPGGSGVVTNTGSVSTTNDGSGQSTASTCVAAPSIQIVKTADNAQVNQGDPIGFTVTVYNAGTGDAKGVNLSDPLPTNTGLSWTIQSQGVGWGGTCAITAGTLHCGPVTVPAATTQAASTFTVHITSPTGAGTGGLCPNSGVVTNTGSVTTTNDGSGQSTASTCVEGVTDLQITKTGSPATQDVPAGSPFQDITWTMIVTNNGPDVDTNVQVGDALPAGTTYVSNTTTAGSCTFAVPTSMLNCDLGTMQVGPGASVTITMVTTPTIEGKLTNTALVTGDLPETTLTNNTASASVLVVAEHKPPSYCTAVIVTPKQLYAGRSTNMHITVVNHHQVVAGVRVRITGPGIAVTTNKSNAKGKITKKLKPKKAGIVTFKPIATKSCKAPRIGITGVFTPPVTG